MLDVDVDQEIKISFPDFYEGDVNYPTLVKGFYVTLDQEFALESYPSEYNQWTNYTYENVGYTKIVSPTENQVVKAKLFERKDGKTEGTIKVKNLGNVKGDVIGFRVYAVNIDGTLYDPDGRAFYVRVGNPYLTRDLAFNVFAETPANSGAIQTGTPIVDQNKKFDEDKTNTEDPFFNVDPDYLQNYNFVLTWGKNNPKVLVGNRVQRLAEVAEGETGYYGNTDADLISELFDFQCTPANPAKYGEGEWDETFKPNYKTSNVSVRLKAANRLINNETYNLVLTIYKRNNNNADPDLNSGSSIIEKVNIQVTKTMPDYLPEAFGVKISQENEAEDMKFYLRPLTSTTIVPSWWGWPTIDYKYSWDLRWFDENNSDEKWGMTKIETDRDLLPYRWATDVRPYNFELIFNGLVAADNSYDQNYLFIFDGCGDVANQDVEENAVSSFRMYGTQMDYNGLDPQGNPKNLKPGYYLPYVHYNVIDTYGSKALSVKASYIYRGVSLTVEDDQPVTGDYVSKAIWFDKDGHEVAEASKAAFKAKFFCAIDNTFTFTLEAPKLGINANAQDAATDGFGASVEKAIPYGLNFSVSNTGEYSAKVGWESNLAAYTNPNAKTASYFRTNFDQFTNTYKDVNGNEGKKKSVYYADGLKVDFDHASEGWANVYRDNKRNPENWLKLVDVELGGKQLSITKMVIYKPNTVKTTADLKPANVEKTLEGESLSRIADYFTVTENKETNGLNFRFLNGDQSGNDAPGLNPGDLGVFEIYLTSGTVSGNILHQWGHKKAATATATTKVYYNRPDSDPNLSRKTR